MYCTIYVSSCGLFINDDGIDDDDNNSDGDDDVDDNSLLISLIYAVSILYYVIHYVWGRLIS